jgi:hypothetical protein
VRLGELLNQPPADLIVFVRAANANHAEHFGALADGTP